MKTKMVVRGVIGLSLFALGFMVALFSIRWIDGNPNNKLDTETTAINSSLQVQMNWLNEAGVVGEREKVDEEGVIICKVTVLLPSIHKTIKMNISEIEYKVLQEEDLVKIHYVYQDEKLLFAQFIRDGKGRIQIEDDRPVVVLDAGHGGFDDGEGSNAYGLEKEFTLAITLKQRELLKESGIRVILTRETDEFVTLYDRCAISNYVDADVFISNHINKFDGETSGIEVLYNLIGDEILAKDLADDLSKQGLDVFKVETRTDERLPGLDYYFVHEYNHSMSYIVEYGYSDSEKDAPIINRDWEAMAQSVCSTLKSYLLEEK